MISKINPLSIFMRSIAKTNSLCYNIIKKEEKHGSRTN